MKSPDEEAILACLRISPHSLEELSHGLMLPVRRVAPIVNELVAAGAIRQLETDRAPSVSRFDILQCVNPAHRRLTR